MSSPIIRTALTVIALTLCSVASEFPAPYNSETNTVSKPLSPADAAAAMKLPPGFRATVFAAEPDVQNPIAMAWDGRGRLWIAENYTYGDANQHFEMRLRDRILIFEDTDGDGKFDKRTVFTDDVQMLTSLEIGRGGVWVTCPPQVLFIPDRNRDDRPDGPAEVVLDGFAVPQESYHNFANGLRFGPDGWLYGRCGGTAPGDIGAPETPTEKRIPLRGGVWRYHTERKVFEAVASGTTNPWGHDWDENGELFFINTVNGHLWHGISGAHFVRGSTVDPNPRAYSLIDTHADHWHFDTGKSWMDSRDGAANTLGGGHAHIGMMIYQGDNWPQKYRGQLFTLNQHGRRANEDTLVREGSGYVGKHNPDFFISEDPWFRGLEIGTGPDGGVFILDWSDTGECHERNGVHRTSGRIYKITYGSPKPAAVKDLAGLKAQELVRLQLHENDWFARRARVELTDRALAGIKLDEARREMISMLKSQTNPVIQLRLLWALHGIGGTDTSLLRSQLRSNNEHIRAWAIRLLSDNWPADTLTSLRPDIATPPISEGLLEEFSRLAKSDPSALVRLTLASTLQKLAVNDRIDIATALAGHASDAKDHNLPLMVWYGLIPVGDSNPAALAGIGIRCEIPLTREYIARRLGEEIEKNPAPLNQLLQFAAGSASVNFQRDVLKGLSDALSGWRKAAKPAAWESLSKRLSSSTDPALRDRARELSVVFGDGRALDEVKKVALDKDADLKVRKAALQTLIESRPPDLRQICEQLLTVRFLNPIAARGLAAFDDPAIGETLAKAYKQFHQSERPQLLATLVSRPVFAKALLNAVGANRIPRTDLSAFHARQIRGFNDPALNDKLKEVWGELQETDAATKERIATLKKQLTAETLLKADKSQGRAVFQTACAVCHRLYGEGAAIGPDLTGAGRDNLDYLLDNIVQPSAVVSADFRLANVNLKDGRTLSGIISAQSARTLTIQTMTEKLTVERSEIESQQASSLSLMPEGLLDALTETQVRDLIAYLMNRTQVPLPAQ